MTIEYILQITCTTHRRVIHLQLNNFLLYNLLVTSYRLEVIARVESLSDPKPLHQFQTLLQVKLPHIVAKQEASRPMWFTIHI